MFEEQPLALQGLLITSGKLHGIITRDEEEETNYAASGLFDNLFILLRNCWMFFGAIFRRIIFSTDIFFKKNSCL